MTTGTENKIPKINYDGVEYDQEKMTDKQKYLFSQLLDIQKKETNARFTMDQILAMKQVFTEQLQKELKEDDKG